jgi:hypothetical protein
MVISVINEMVQVPFPQLITIVSMDKKRKISRYFDTACYACLHLAQVDGRD